MDLVRHTATGRVSGVQLPGENIAVYRGIPYARPPIGALRWRAPQPAESWFGIRDGSRFGPTAWQRLAPADSLFGFETGNDSEDCLYLNVWAGSRTTNDLRPVIVFFHIGAFQYGSGSQPLYDGANWARAGAVLVTFNFRLGRLGFLAHPELSEESGASGNYGLLDQIAALEWVRDNIANFGGDPNCVTIFGVSAGASSVSLLMNSSRARGLFHRAIAESGGSFGPIGRNTGMGDRWQRLKDAERSGAHWAKAIGAPGLAELRAMDGDGIGRANARPVEAGDATFDALRPIVDGDTLTATSFATFAAGRQALVPLLVGSAAQEEFAVAPSHISAAAYRDQARAGYGDATDEFLNLYPARDDDEAARSALRAIGDRLFTWQNWAWARLHAPYVADTYYYRFTQAPPVPVGPYHERKGERSLGAFHGASLFYSFGNLGLRDWDWSKEDRRMARMMILAWVRFAKTGKPAAEGLADWPAFDPEDPAMMSLSAFSQLEAVPDLARMSFWDRFYASSQ